jgi:hypothetical protein
VGHKFSNAERFAIFSIHGGKCYINSEPIDLRSMAVDHIIPEQLADAPEELAEVLRQYGLPSDFDLNSFSNLLPACGPCNRRKSSQPFRPTPLIQSFVDRARSRASDVETLARKVVSDQQLSKALATIEFAVEGGHLEIAALAPLVRAYAKAQERIPDDQSRSSDAAEFRATPFFSVLYDADSYRMVTTPYGTGYVPTVEKPHASFYCGHCGSRGPWSGARCLSCGHLVEDD